MDFLKIVQQLIEVNSSQDATAEALANQLMDFYNKDSLTDALYCFKDEYEAIKSTKENPFCDGDGVSSSGQIVERFISLFKSQVEIEAKQAEFDQVKLLEDKKINTSISLQNAERALNTTEGQLKEANGELQKVISELRVEDEKHYKKKNDRLKDLIISKEKVISDKKAEIQSLKDIADDNLRNFKEIKWLKKSVPDLEKDIKSLSPKDIMSSTPEILKHNKERLAFLESLGCETYFLDLHNKAKSNMGELSLELKALDIILEKYKNDFSENDKELKSIEKLRTSEKMEELEELSKSVDALQKTQSSQQKQCDTIREELSSVENELGDKSSKSIKAEISSLKNENESLLSQKSDARGKIYYWLKFNELKQGVDFSIKQARSDDLVQKLHPLIEMINAAFHSRALHDEQMCVLINALYDIHVEVNYQMHTPGTIVGTVLDAYIEGAKKDVLEYFTKIKPGKFLLQDIENQNIDDLIAHESPTDNTRKAQNAIKQLDSLGRKLSNKGNELNSKMNDDEQTKTKHNGERCSGLAKRFAALNAWGEGQKIGAIIDTDPMCKPVKEDREVLGLLDRLKTWVNETFGTSYKTSTEKKFDAVSTKLGGRNCLFRVAAPTSDFDVNESQSRNIMGATQRA